MLLQPSSFEGLPVNVDCFFTMVLFVQPEAAVDRMIAVIKAKDLATCIPEREICILAVACVDLVKNHDIDPQAEAVIVQTVARKDFSTLKFYCQIFHLMDPN